MSKRMKQRWPDDTLSHSCHTREEVKLVACKTHPAVKRRKEKKTKNNAMGRPWMCVYVFKTLCEDNYEIIRAYSVFDARGSLSSLRVLEQPCNYDLA